MKLSWLFLLAAMLCTTASIAGLNRAPAGHAGEEKRPEQR
jgi:hypothetical protein